MATLHDLLLQVKQVNDKGKAQSDALSVVQGLVPRPLVGVPGQNRWVSEEELLSLEIPVLHRNGGGFVGFQRTLDPTKARKIGRAMLEGKQFPPIDASILPDGRVVGTDGQHRGAGAVIARMPALVAFTERSYEAARQIFADQGKGTRVNANVLVLSASDAFSEYVQDACTRSDHVWSDLVGEQASEGRISASQMRESISGYCLNRLGTSRDESGSSLEFSERLADEMGILLRAFGTKKTNFDAFRPTSVRAITSAAILIIRRRDSRKADIDRWGRHMPTFSFSDYRHLRRGTELTDALRKHWNKHLVSRNQVPPASR